ncbi:MAG: hypothetical protein A2Z05_07945 [Chloroflexi bacterium RBG_16_60_22]|nr:MAG: hypothetical protein A2Z05_07945 [Chloroflexi bacterium RBG_16_60_22]
MNIGTVKTAAIWARISGPDQQSLPSQVAEVKEWLQAQGFIVPMERILMVDWTSKDILRCPEMQKLLSWVANREVEVVGSLHLDRFAARPGQMSQIFDTFKDAEVQLLLKQTPLPPGLMGELMGLVITMGKALSVERADQGAKKGLHDRPKIHRVPVTYRKPYGFIWRRDPPRLEPDENWDTVRFICREGLAGRPTRALVRKLKEMGIPSPTGNPEWSFQTIYDIFRNPLYGGRFYALRSEAVEPTHRMCNTYGRSSQRWLPFDQWEYLPEVKVENAPLTWEEWLSLQRRRTQNKLMAKRNAKHDYLLRGLVFCNVHNRRYKGHAEKDRGYAYVCPVEGGHGFYFHGYINGPRLEQTVKRIVTNQVAMEAIWRNDQPDTTEESLQNEMRRLELSTRTTVNGMVELERRSLSPELEDERYRIKPEIYERLKCQYEAKLKWVSERKVQLQAQLNNLKRRAEAVVKLNSIYDRVEGKLESLTNQEWRDLLLELGATIHVTEDGFLEPRFELHLGPEKSGAIVSSVP